jgi:hypothetical protein
MVQQITRSIKPTPRQQHAVNCRVAFAGNVYDHVRFRHVPAARRTGRFRDTLPRWSIVHKRKLVAVPLVGLNGKVKVHVTPRETAAPVTASRPWP